MTDQIDPNTGMPVVGMPAPQTIAMGLQDNAPAAVIAPIAPAAAPSPDKGPATAFVPQFSAPNVGPMITIDSTATRGIAMSLTTGALRIVGTAMVAHGVMTQGAVDGLIPVAAQEIVGTAVLLIGQFWAWLREQASHSKTLAAAMAMPSQIVVKGQ